MKNSIKKTLGIINKAIQQVPKDKQILHTERIAPIVHNFQKDSES